MLHRANDNELQYILPQIELCVVCGSPLNEIRWIFSDEQMKIMECEHDFEMDERTYNPREYPSMLPTPCTICGRTFGECMSRGQKDSIMEWQVFYCPNCKEMFIEDWRHNDEDTEQ